MTVKERMKAAGYDPDLAKQTIYDGSYECDSIQIRIYKCRPWQYGPMAVAVEATAIVEWSDGSFKPVSYGGIDTKLVAYFPEDDLPFAEPNWPNSYQPVIVYDDRL